MDTFSLLMPGSSKVAVTRFFSLSSWTSTLCLREARNQYMGKGTVCVPWEEDARRSVSRLALDLGAIATGGGATSEGFVEEAVEISERLVGEEVEKRHGGNAR